MGGPLRILLVEDEAAQRLLVRDILTRLGGTVLEAGSVAAARALLAREPIDVLVCDQFLGDGTGLETAEGWVREHPDGVAILMTAAPSSELSETAADAGVADFVDKATLTADGLGRAIRYALRRRDDRRALRAERQELLAAVQRQRRILANLPGTVITLHDRELRVVDTEGLPADDPSGYTQETIRGVTLRDLIAPADHDRLRRLLCAGLEGRRGSAEYVSPDGRHFAVEIAPFVEDEQITGVLAVWYDRTARVRLEQDRARLDVEMHTAFDAAPIGMVMVGLDGRFLRANRAISEITGYSEAELLGQQPFFFVHPADAERVRARFASIGSRPGEGVQIEHRIVHAQGHTAWVDARVTVMPGEDGEARYALAQVQEISERHAHEESQRRHAEQLAAIAEVTRAVGHSEPLDARQTICRVAIDSSDGITAASIWERCGDGSLELTAAEPRMAGPRKLPADSSHGSRVVLETGELLFVPDAQTSAHTDRAMLDVTRASTVAFVPIADEQTVRAVLAVAWAEPVATLDTGVRLLLNVLAGEAAVALGRAELLARLDELTRTDELTGLPNRRGWDELLTRELITARRHERPLAVALLDLDHFKRYNDEHGHLAGDRLLREAARAWSGHIRANDVLARWGGEEFALCLPACGGADAAALIGRLRGLLPDGVTFSAGIVVTDGDSQATELLDAADRALYEAKAAGRDRIVVR